MEKNILQRLQNKKKDEKKKIIKNENKLNVT